jgi:AcrR family transcriptional regulator
MKQNVIASAKRLSILDAASRIIMERGVTMFTLEPVAHEAGISKGGLLYHFPTKDSLITGMIERLIDQFEADLERELDNNAGDWLAAYIRVAGNPNPHSELISNSIFAALANNPGLLMPLRARFDKWQKRAETASPSPEFGTIIRLTMDGLWLSGLLNFAPPAPALRIKVLEMLSKMVSISD